MALDAPPIRDAATLVIVDDSVGEPRVLMGRRRPDQVFLPNVFVFPGGRADADDLAVPAADELDADEAALVAVQRDGSRLTPAQVRGLALAAIRETFEETGIIAGTLGSGHNVAGSWMPFLAQGYLPVLSPLRYFLRAITPPARPRRYDTRFFLLNATAIARRTTPLDEELTEVGWYKVSDLSSLAVPRITKVAIEELRKCLTTGLLPAAQRRVPLYFEQNNVMRREELSLSRDVP